jgi:hypothetical protein
VIRAVLYSRDLCPSCYDDWGDWKRESFRVFMCDTMPKPPPRPSSMEHDPCEDSGVFGFTFNAATPDPQAPEEPSSP